MAENKKLNKKDLCACTDENTHLEFVGLCSTNAARCATTVVVRAVRVHPGLLENVQWFLICTLPGVKREIAQRLREGEKNYGFPIFYVGGIRQIITVMTAI